MKAEAQIPKGWRKLRRGTLIRRGDRCRWYVPAAVGWRETECEGEKVGATAFTEVTYIRRKVKKARAR